MRIELTLNIRKVQRLVAGNLKLTVLSMVLVSPFPHFSHSQDLNELPAYLIGGWEQVSHVDSTGKSNGKWVLRIEKASDKPQQRYEFFRDSRVEYCVWYPDIQKNEHLSGRVVSLRNGLVEISYTKYIFDGVDIISGFGGTFRESWHLHKINDSLVRKVHEAESLMGAPNTYKSNYFQKTTLHDKYDYDEGKIPEEPTRNSSD